MDRHMRLSHKADMRPNLMPLPIDDVLPELLARLQVETRAVLVAPPGAGKTTRVPRALFDANVTKGRIIVLEPRRLAARAVAERIAEELGEPCGQSVGYRIRGESKVSPSTRIEIVTEGILTRMIQSDPELSGVGAVIFDEFHERSLNADLGLALAWEIKQALREDLILLVMSATLHSGPVAELLNNAPVVLAEGRSFPVETRFLDRPIGKDVRFEDAIADLTLTAVRETDGGVLVFLPGEGEIRRVEAKLKARMPQGCNLRPLFGALPFEEQRAAIAPLESGRKIVLATSIAETSLTIEDIRVVIDGGRTRRSRYDPSSGMSRLVTEKVSKAEATQRAGRAGRVAEGTAYKLWTKGEDGALALFPPSEIEAADLAGLALEMAVWGTTDLPFLTPPPEGTLREATELLKSLDALDDQGRITEHGRSLAALPLHPRLAHMLHLSGKAGAMIAAILAERDPLRNAPVDLALRVKALRGNYRGPGQLLAPAAARIQQESRRLSHGLGEKPALSLGEMVALAYPDRIAMRREGDAPRFILSGGKGAILDAGDPFAGQKFLVATDLDGDPREARIRQAALISENAIRDLFANRIHTSKQCAWSKRERRVIAQEVETLGALTLSAQKWSAAPEEEIARAMLDGVRELGIRLDGAARRLRARVEILRQGGADLPAMDDQSLLGTLEDWLLPHLGRVKSAEDWKRFDPHDALLGMLDWNQRQRLDQDAPAHFTTPLGRKVPVDYDGEAPEITLRLQEMFGVTRHPMIGREPLRVVLLSPGGKPIQITRDIPGFWASSYEDVRKDMRGRYPKHPWPDDPTVAEPTLRAKPRGT